MSTPLNVLSKYRTYSYHHILIICDSVTTATSISIGDNSSGKSQLNRTVRQSINGQYSSERVSTDDATGGKYIIMANGLTDSHYVIDELKWESITGQQGNHGSGNYTAMVTEGGMVINEPKGVRFLNDVKMAYEQLNRDHNSCVWMIKTIFVGYNDQHSSRPSQPEYLTNIKPLIFTVIDLEAEFSVQGAIYDIKFVNINNGVSKLPQINDITSTVKMNLTKTTELSSALNTLFNNIQIKYNKYFKTVEADIISQGLKPLPIKYNLELSKEYENAIYKVDDILPQNSTGGVANSGASLDFSKGITIENAIKTIMNKCPQVKKDAKGETESGDKFGYKIRSIIASTTTEYAVNFYVERQKLMFNNVFNAAKSNDPAIQTQLDENTLKFDYVYTGNNIDIIDYSMKMEMGLVFFQQITNGNNLATQEDSISQNVSTIDQTTVKTDAKVNQVEDGSKDKLQSIPIFFTKNNKNSDLINTKNPKDTAEFQSLLDRHAALENIQAKIKIQGNPSLLNSTNKIPKGFSSNSKEIVDDDSVFPHWEKVPALAEINILMPIEENGVVLKMEKFWYTGKYYVFTVANEFSGGLFTQELEMISMPNSIEEESSSNTKDKTEDFTVKNVESIKKNKDGSITRLINGKPQVKVKPYVPKQTIDATGGTVLAKLESIKQLNVG